MHTFLRFQEIQSGKQRNSTCERTWHQFFMRLSCYWSWISPYHYQSGCGSNVITRSLPVTGQTLDNLNSICFFTITNCQLVNSYLLTHCINYKFVSALSDYWQRKLENFCSYRRIHIEGWNERSYSERALKTCSRLRLWCVYDIMSFFSLRSASRNGYCHVVFTRKKELLQSHASFLGSPCLILTLLGFVSASGNTNTSYNMSCLLF